MVGMDSCDVSSEESSYKQQRFRNDDSSRYTSSDANNGEAPISYCAAVAPAIFGTAGVCENVIPLEIAKEDITIVDEEGCPTIWLHGTFGNMTNAWQRLSPYLKGLGYCVFALDYGAGTSQYPIRGSADIRTSADEIDRFVARVRTATRAAKVDLVGHSQGGGITPRWYLKFDGGSQEVGTLVGLAPSNHGTTLLGLGSLARSFGYAGSFGPAAEQQIVGSSANAQLDAGGDTVGTVRYTTIVSRYDEVVTPHTQQFLTGSRVTNILLQTGCPVDLSEHLGVAYSPRAMALVANALDPAHPVAVPCVPRVGP